MHRRNDQLHVQAIEEKQKIRYFGVMRYWKDSQEMGLFLETH